MTDATRVPEEKTFLSGTPPRTAAVPGLAVAALTAAKTASGQVREPVPAKNQAGAVGFGERITGVHVRGNDTVGRAPPFPFRRCPAVPGGARRWPADVGL
ncbi:hypothetical protein [Kitasatospora sp. NPDC059599]|uniref:hypothetical protein n=1 Tax=Kitasatospora sp. NPDC059599 TaxID=3346880 RepID=UPI00369C9BDE